ncbi:MAG: preprotein translocase subunit SecA [Tractidigestivibacter sp.]|uniref:preprotein translocase subunit SecA n=1 Tax=Tractidigestivibacter sp. TaxID=2847320 RepID=UPI003D8B8863
MPNFLSKLLSIGSNKELKEYEKITNHVNELEPRFHAMSDEELKAMTPEFRERYANGETLDDLLPEAFAAVREASLRTTGMRHFDVQIIGGIALHRGTIAEMKTGEGKTLVATLAAYLNAIPGKGVHIVTVNDYLAKRDSEWMGQIYRFMGLSVGLLQNGMRLNLKKPAYQADITYGTNSEFGFDYLRDNMVTRPNLRVQRGHNYAIVDEVDSILIDEARTPLIISGAGTKSASTYKDFARAVRGLTPDVDFEMDEAKHTIAATDTGLVKIEHKLGIDDIYSDPSGQLVNHLQQALKAEYMFHRDQQYVVVDGEVKIVDEFTGRIMEGRRYSEGLHQAIEAKEGVQIREENQTLATITLQNYFLMYDKLAGMTGTALTEDAEFREVYHIPVQVIPPNKPVIRVDHDDLVYRTIDYKFKAVADDVERRHAKGQPCLVGTVSIENSERLSRILDKRGIKHNVLNAKYHEREAQIVAQAGREGAVTIATNMAGRGTDILLGGNPEVMAEDMLREQGFYAPAKEGEEPLLPTEEQKKAALDKAKAICEREREHVIAAGGLAVIGTERHESRRIDNQLRGRSGRQGDPGETQFYLSLEDDLMRLFGGDRMDKIAELMKHYDMPADMPIQAKIVTRAVEGAQLKVEEVNFAMRKNVLDYDDVMNKQRQVIYEERNKILDGKDLMSHIEEVTRETIQRKADEYCSPEIDDHEQWALEDLTKWLRDLTGRKDAPEFSVDDEQDEIVDKADEYVMRCYNEKAERLTDRVMKELSTQVMLRVIDTRWMSYLQEMDYLKTGIGLRGYGQRDPLAEYKTEAYAAFTELVNTMYEDFLRTILRIEIAVKPAAENPKTPKDEDADLAAELKGARYSGPAEVDGDQGGRRPQAPRRGAGRSQESPQGNNPGASKPRTYRKADDPDPFVGVGRNDPCPCGSGKKFKNCHGRNR